MPLLGEVMVMFMADTAGFTSGAGLVVAGLVGIGAAIGESVKAAGDFQAGVTNLATAAGESAGNLGMVGEGIKKVATDTGTGTKDLIAAMFMIESSGAHGAAGLNELSIAARGAKTDNAELMVVSKALTGVMAGWPATTNGAAGAMNELIVAASEGKMHLQDLSKAMGNVIPIASAAGVSFADIGAAVAMMTNKNMTAQRASQNVAFALRDLSAPSGIAQKAMASVGLSAQDLKDTLSHKGLGATLQEITDAVGNTFPAGSIEATTALKNIMGGASGLNVALALGGKNLSEYEKGVKKIADAAKNGGQAVEGWSTVQGNFNTKMDRAKASMEVLGITLGTDLLPLIGNLLDQVAPLVTNFIAWESKTHGVENAVKALATGIGNMISAGAGIVKFFQNNQVALSALEAVLVVVAAVGIMLFIQALVALGVAAVLAAVEFLPMIATIAVIALAITGIILLIKNWGAVMDWLTGKTKQSQLQQQELYQKNALKTIQSSEEQKRGVLANMEDERSQLIAKIKGMADGADKSREQIRLSALNAQINTTKGDLKELDNEKAQHLKILKDLQAQDPQIREQTKLAAIKKQVEQKDALLKTLDNEKTQLIAKILDEKDGSNKQRDLMKLDAINKQIATTTGTIKALTTEGTQHKQKLNDMIASDLEARKNWITRASDSLQAWGDDQLKKLNTTIQGWSNGLQRWGNDTLSNMNATFQGWGNGVQNWGDTTLNNLNSTIQGWGSGLQQWGNNTLSFLGGLAGDFASGLGGIANSAFQWGANIVQNIAAGIQNSIGAVISAAQNVANAIANFLPHSPAKEGPLSKLDEFGPALVHGIASGVDNSSHMLKSSMDHLFTPTSGSGQGVSGSGQGASSGGNTFILQIDGREMARALGPHFTNEIRLVAQVRR